MNFGEGPTGDFQQNELKRQVTDTRRRSFLDTTSYPFFRLRFLFFSDVWEFNWVPVITGVYDMKPTQTMHQKKLKITIDLICIVWSPKNG